MFFAEIFANINIYTTFAPDFEKSLWQNKEIAHTFLIN